MNRQFQFALLVQTGVLLLDRNISPLTRTQVLADAMALPEESIPQNLVEGSWEFIRWKTMGYVEPAWLKEYRENIGTRVYVEQCEGTRQWWQNVESLLPSGAPKSWTTFVSGRTPIVEMTKKDAIDFLDWAREVPGWSEEEPSVRIHEEQPT